MSEPFELEPYQPSLADEWDGLVAAAPNGIFMLSRRFISYHGDRFDDRSLLVRRKGRLVAVLPAAVVPGDGSTVASHPGLTYGGLVCADDLRGAAVLEILGTVAEHYAGQGFSSLVYKSVPHVLHRRSTEDDSYAMFRLGAVRSRCDLSAVVDLADPGPLSSNRKRNLKKARSAGLTIERDWSRAAEYWDVLAERLREAHEASPTHTLDEIELLRERFPDEIDLLVACEGSAAVAGIVEFRYPTMVMAQYIASNQAGRDANALDLVFDTAFDQARDAGYRWFNFGISTDVGGTVLNEGLYQYKTSFGAGGTVQEHYTLGL